MTSEDLIFKEIKQRLDNQFETLNVLITKTSIVIGLIGVILGFIFTSSSQKNYFFYIVGVTLLLVSLGITIYAGILTKKYYRDPEPRPLYENYWKEEEGETKKILASNWVEAFEKNRKTLDLIPLFLNLSVFILFIGLIFLVMAFGVCNA